MVRRGGTLFLVLALVVSTGGHWAVLQACAWAGMLVRYAREASVQEAVVKTFDGRHPCRLCQVIREGRAEERKAEAPLPAARFELVPPRAAVALVVVAGEPRPAAFDGSAAVVQRREPPPVPPPRAV